MRRVINLIVGILGGILFAVFILSLFSLEAGYSFATATESEAMGSTTTTSFGLSLTGGFYQMLGFAITFVTHTTITGGTVDPGTGEITGYSTNVTSEPPAVTQPTGGVTLLVAIALLVFIVGMSVCLKTKKNKVAAIVGIVFVAAAVAMYFIVLKADAFQGFHFAIINEGEGTEVVNFGISWLSTGLLMAVLAGLSLIKFIFIITAKKKKAVANPE